MINGIYCLPPPSQGLPYLVRAASVVVYSSSSSFPGPSPGRGQPHLSITCDITEGDIPQQSTKRLYATVGRVSCIASRSSCIIQLEPTVQPAAFSLIRVQSQRILSFSISLPPAPFYSYHFSSFFCPSVMWPSCKGLKFK